MRNKIALAGAIGAVVTSLTSPALADPAPQGALCGVATSDVGNPNTQNGAIFGGPLALTDDTNPLITYSGALVCSVQVNANTHASPNACTGTGLASGNAAALAPTPCTYLADDDDQMYVCTQVNLLFVGVRYYDAPTGAWSSSNTARCQPAIQIATSPIEDARRDVVDPELCMVLANFFPPEGDVGIFYDCPPYTTPGLIPGVNVVIGAPANL